MFFAIARFYIPTKQIQRQFPLIHSPISTILTDNSPIRRIPSNQTIGHIGHLDSLLASSIQVLPQIPPEPTTCYTTLFFHLRSSANLREARKVHGLLLVNGFYFSNSNAELLSLLLNIYASFDSLQESLLVFNCLPTKTVFAWNSILRCLLNLGQFSEAFEFYHLMMSQGLIPDNFTYPLVLKACSGLRSLDHGRKIWESICFNELQHKIKPNIYVECAMIDMFAKCGSLHEARQVFGRMSQRDLVSWTAMICGTVQNGDYLDALNLFLSMRLDGLNPDSVIVATVLPACGRLEALQLGKGLQGFAVRSGIEKDLCVSNAFIDMYCKCGDTHEAHHVFSHMESKDVITWSSLIAGHSQNYEYSESFELYVQMNGSGMRPSSVTLAGVLPAFANLKLFKQGKEIHNYAIRQGFEFDGFVASALVDMYAKCGSIREAERVFEVTFKADIAVWNSMIAGYALHEDFKSAFQTLRRTQDSNFRPNSITIMTILPLCTRLGMLRQGKEIHGCTTRIGLGSVVSVANPLIDMYCKCGCLEFGVKVFEQMIEKDIVTYNTIISAVGMHGDGQRSFSFYRQMKQARITPNKVTFVALLAACSHAGLTDRGWFIYKSMIHDYGIVPEMEHYSCMVDLLARSGHLDDAWEFIKIMPVEPGIDVLGSLVGACRVHKRIKLAELVGKQIFDKHPEDPGYYVLLSNIYATAGRWEDVYKMRTIIRERGLTKKPGSSWIQVGCSVYVFLARERSHPQIDRIHKVLGSLLLQMKDEGYIPDTSFFLHDLGGNCEDFTSID